MEKYEASIWVTGCTHVINVQSEDIYLSEVVSSPGQVLPERGLVERFHFQGPKTHKLTMSRGASYMTNFQVEKMSNGLYQQSHRDLERFARNRGLFVNYSTDENSELNPFCYIDFEARKNELHVHTFSAYPEQVTIVKTQSLFEFH